MLLELRYYHKNKTKEVQKCKFIFISYEKECKKLMHKMGLK